ncbi:MAG: ABC-F family ATP-binding cassette domain-containing protein, partial [Clostridia bacterium]|nr:ABC-F family ATP-binding cassette domain-containing protein [Clostridia bacterium]
VGTLSGGERGRVARAKLMLRQDNLLLLDEPTNHLDMDSREVLEAALEDFEGTLLTVSHDRYFINRVATKVIEMSPEGAVEYLGNYDDYLEKKQVQAAGEEEWSAGGATRTQIDKEKRRQRLAKESAKALQAKLKKAEEDIAATEQLISDLEEQMGKPEIYSNPAESARVAREHREAQARLDGLYEEWEALSEAVSGE